MKAQGLKRMDNKLKNKIKHTVRYLAVDILESVENEGAYSNLLLNKVILSESCRLRMPAC